MDPTAMFIAALVLLPAFGLATWTWFSMAQVEEDMIAISALEGLRFEDCLSCDADPRRSVMAHPRVSPPAAEASSRRRR